MLWDEPVRSRSGLLCELVQAAVVFSLLHVCSFLLNPLPHFVLLYALQVPKGFGIFCLEKQYFSLKLNLSLLVELFRHVPLNQRTVQC